jgi:hypothetical protein
MAWIARGVQKPPFGASINWAHPFAQDLRVALLFSDFAAGNLTTTQLPTVIQAGPPATPWACSLNGTPTWTSNNDGSAVQFTTSSNSLIINPGGTDPIPTGDTTILFIRRKTDTTLRNAPQFGGSTTVAQSCGAWIPYLDGKIYWDFGGDASPNRLATGVLTWGTTVERFVFTAGARGSTIWRNGVKEASQATAITRSTTAGQFLINAGHIGGNPGDTMQVNFFQLLAAQWSDDLCAWWSAEPYEHLYSEQARTSMFLAGNLAVSTPTVPTKKGGAKGGPGGKTAYGPSWLVNWDSVNSFGAN